MPFVSPTMFGSKKLDSCSLTFGATSSLGAQSSTRYWHPITVNKDVEDYIELVDNTDVNYKYAKFYDAEDGNTFRFTLEQNFTFSYKSSSSPFILTLGTVGGDFFGGQEDVFTVWTDTAQSPDPVEITLDDSLPVPYTGLYLAMSVPPYEAYTQTQDAIVTIQRV